MKSCAESKLLLSVKSHFYHYGEIHDYPVDISDVYVNVFDVHDDVPRVHFDLEDIKCGVLV